MRLGQRNKHRSAKFAATNAGAVSGYFGGLTGVPNNDLRYEINKLRAKLFAARHGRRLMWCHAKDTPSPEALKDDPTLPSKKISWLQRHERQCGGLTGMLPIVLGMQVALTDHLDRSPEKRLLKGAVGFIHSVHLHLDDVKASTQARTRPCVS